MTSSQDIEFIWQFPRLQDSAVAAGSSTQSMVDFIRTNRIQALLSVYDPKFESAMALVSEMVRVKVEPVVPNMATYIRDTTDRGITGAALVRFKRLHLSQQAHIIWRSLRRARRIIAKDFNTGILLLVEMELAKFQKWKPDYVFLHPWITDLVLALGNKNLFLDYVHLIRRIYRLNPGLMSHNYGRLVPELKEWGIEVGALLGPFNRKGYLMNPSQKECEQARRESRAEVIASHIDAGGTIDRVTSTEYLQKLNIRKALIRADDCHGNA